ncbi:retrovirus-related pol polyprotein from transposon TNT 1-94 [Tanacetum coccineum]
MTGSLCCLTEVRDVVRCLLGFPNGDQAVATKSGIVNLDGKIKLLNDYTSRIQIRAGELREGLYYFGSAASASALKKLKDVLFDLWHKRLGHPSAKIVELLPDVGTPSTNMDKVERKHRHILNVARALRFQANLPIDFWGECVLTAGYLINRTPFMVLKGKMPHKLLHGKPPSYDNFRVFGCLCYVHNQTRHGDKFSSKSRRCIFVGYPYGKKGWRVYDLELGVFLVSQDIVFSEMEFPYMDNSSHHLEPISSSINVDMCDDSVFENNDEVTTQINSRSEPLVAFESGAVVENSDVNQNEDVSESNNPNSYINSSQHDVDATVDVGLTGNTKE